MGFPLGFSLPAGRIRLGSRSRIGLGVGFVAPAGSLSLGLEYASPAARTGKWAHRSPAHLPSKRRVVPDCACPCTLDGDTWHRRNNEKYDRTPATANPRTRFRHCARLRHDDRGWDTPPARHGGRSARRAHRSALFGVLRFGVLGRVCAAASGAYAAATVQSLWLPVLDSRCACRLCGVSDCGSGGGSALRDYRGGLPSELRAAVFIDGARPSTPSGSGIRLGSCGARLDAAASQDQL